MPFNEPQNLTVSVTQQDIDNASAGNFTNSLAQALIRLNAAKQLPGQENDTNPQTGCAFYSEVSPILIGFQVYLAQAFVCSFNYGTDLNTAVIIAAENLGVAPSAPYTATLTKA